MYMKVKALAIDHHHFWYKCPNNCPEQYHKHGSNNDLSNRVEHRMSHCFFPQNVEIYINEQTFKATILKTFKHKNKILIKPLL